MSSFIKQQMILFDYRQKNNWFLDLDEEVENNPLKKIPLPLDYILFDETSFHLLSKGCQLQSDKEEPFDFKKPNILDKPNIPDKSTEDNKVVNKAKKNILQEEEDSKRVIDSTESTERKDKIEIKKMIFSTKKANENEETYSNSRKDDEVAKKSGGSRKYFRVEDAKKHIKKAISQFATQELNRLIKSSELGTKFKKPIHLPNYKLFTSNSKELDNLDFLSFNLKKVFTYGKKDGNRQDKNEKNLNRILEYKKYPEKTKKIKEFLDLTYQDIIKLFYQSSNFEEFRNTKLTQFFDEGIKSQKKISLLEDGGLLKLFEMTKKKKKEKFCFSS
jgi:hypothetical protein